MKPEERTYALLPIILATHRYQVGKVKFQVASHFKGKATIEERLADLMIEDLCGESSEKSGENE